MYLTMQNVNTACLALCFSTYRDAVALSLRPWHDDLVFDSWIIGSKRVPRGINALWIF